MGTRLLPPRAKGPTLTVALASIDSRNVSGARSAAALTWATCSKIASVWGIFFGAESWPPCWDSSPAHSVCWQLSAQSVIRYRYSPSPRSIASALRQQSDGYTIAWYETAGRLGSGYQQWLEYRSASWADVLRRACGGVA